MSKQQELKGRNCFVSVQPCESFDQESPWNCREREKMKEPRLAHMSLFKKKSFTYFASEYIPTLKKIYIYVDVKT